MNPATLLWLPDDLAHLIIEHVDGFDLDAEDVAKLDALTTPAAIEAWRAHYEKRRAGTPAPWGDCPRPAA